MIPTPIYDKSNLYLEFEEANNTYSSQYMAVTILPSEDNTDPTKKAVVTLTSSLNWLGNFTIEKVASPPEKFDFEEYRKKKYHEFGLEKYFVHEPDVLYYQEPYKIPDDK